MELTVEEQIARVQQQERTELGSDTMRNFGEEEVATISHHSSMAVGALYAAEGGGWVGLAAYAAAIGGGKAGAWLSEVLGADEVVADGLELMGMHRIGAGGPHPARQGDQVAHSFALMGMLATLAIGAVAALAVGALIVATGGLAAPVVAAAVIGGAGAGGLAAGFYGSALAGALSSMGSKTGPITINCSQNVKIEGKWAARMTATAACAKDGTPQPIIEGSATIFVNGLPLPRIGHKLLCGATIDEGATSVFMDQSTIACARPAPDVPVWARVALDWVGFLPLGKMAAAAGKRTRSAAARGKAACNRTCAKDPVDVATGEFVEWRTDFTVPGVLPLSLTRRYFSGSSPDAPISVFGAGWRDNWGVELRALDDARQAIEFHDEEGLVLIFDTPGSALDAENVRAPHLWLTGTHVQPELHDRRSGVCMHFEWQGGRAVLSAWSDASGNRIDFERDDHRRPSVLRHSDGWSAQCQYAGGNLQSIHLDEPDHAPVELARYRHDAHGRLEHAASEGAGRQYYHYDDAGRIIGWGDDSATHVRIDYDDAGRAVRVEAPDGLHSGRFEYDTQRRITYVHTANPRDPDRPLVHLYESNADGLVVRERDALGHETFVEWSTTGKLLARIDALGRTTRYRYDDAQRLIAVIAPDGQTTTIAYDDAGRVTRVADAHGRAHASTYDELGRRQRDTAPDGTWIDYAYDDRGRLVSEQHSDDRCFAFHYDAHHRPSGHTAPNGGVTRWRQDRLGRVEEWTDAAGATTRYAHAPSGTMPRLHGHAQPVRIEYPDGGVEQIAYTCEGLPDSHTDAHGNERRWQWGAFDLLQAQTDAQGAPTRYRYGHDGQLIELLNALGQRWQWLHDAAGRLHEQVDYAGRRTRWERDVAGRPLVRIAPDGVRLQYHWDAADRVLGIHASDGTRVSYDYDPRDRLVRARVWSGATPTLESDLQLEYDDADRLIAETHRLGENGEPRRIGYTFDVHGRCIGRNGPLGETRYAFDALGLLAELHTAHGSVHLQRDVLGQVVERASLPLGSDSLPARHQPPHFRLFQQHDVAGRLTFQRAGRFDSVLGNDDTLRRHYQWRHDRLQAVQDARFGDSEWNTDARDQVRQARHTPTTHGTLSPLPGLQFPSDHAAPAAESFDYDRNGNVSAINGQRLHYRADTVERVGDSRYRWDACGRLVERTRQRPGFRPQSWQYRWDAFDRLRQVITPEGRRWRYVYDAFGRRRSRVCENPGANPPGSRRRLQRAETLWDGATVAAHWKVYADGTPGLACECYEWHHEPGGFTALAVTQQTDQRTRLLHVVGDPNGAPRELLDGEGEVVWAGQLDTWGHLVRCEVRDRNAGRVRYLPGYQPAANDPEIDVELRFANQWADEESGLHYNLNRHYAPELGQYASQDPLGPAGGLRTHGYVHNPLTWVDPLGLSGCPTGDGIGVPRTRSPNSRDPVLDFDKHGNEIFYRTMSPSDFAKLNRTGKLPATSETFVSPSESYSRGYDGILVRLTTKPGTSQELMGIGVTANPGTAAIFPGMPRAAKGWTASNAMFKVEGGVTNTGLGRGRALDIFNKNIVTFDPI